MPATAEPQLPLPGPRNLARNARTHARVHCEVGTGDKNTLDVTAPQRYCLAIVGMLFTVRR